MERLHDGNDELRTRIATRHLRQDYANAGPAFARPATWAWNGNAGHGTQAQPQLTRGKEKSDESTFHFCACVATHCTSTVQPEFAIKPARPETANARYADAG